MYIATTYPFLFVVSFVLQETAYAVLSVFSKFLRTKNDAYYSLTLPKFHCFIVRELEPVLMRNVFLLFSPLFGSDNL